MSYENLLKFSERHQPGFFPFHGGGFLFCSSTGCHVCGLRQPCRDSTDFFHVVTEEEHARFKRDHPEHII